MSQTKTLTNLEKGKLLKAERKRLDLTQEQMAKALNLDPTYLSQLENGKRPVDDSYLEKAQRFEKSNSVKDAPYGNQNSVYERCHQYLAKVLEACDGDEDKLRWTFVELQKRFPLPDAEERTTATRAKMGAAAAVERLGLSGPDEESPPSSTVPSTNDKTGGPDDHTRPHQDRQRTPPGRVPK